MTVPEKFDRVLLGFVSGLIFPVITGLIIYLFSSGDYSLFQYLNRVISSDIVTHAITICVFSNIVIFMISNRLDMLRLTRGILIVTIMWAILVVGIKFL